MILEISLQTLGTSLLIFLSFYLFQRYREKKKLNLWYLLLAFLLGWIGRSVIEFILYSSNMPNTTHALIYGIAYIIPGISVEYFTEAKGTKIQ
jgi:hypothetical protein